MNILYLLVPAAVLLALTAVAAFAWAVRTGQFDDVRTPAVRAILDDEPADEEGTDRALLSAKEADTTSDEHHG